MTPGFATSLLGWKRSKANALSWAFVPNCADTSNTESLRIARGMLDELGISSSSHSDVPDHPGIELEKLVRDDLAQGLPARRELDWKVARGQIIADFDQYGHLRHLDKLVQSSPDLRVTIGTDYLIRPDVTVAIGGVATASGLAPLHAAISCKWTIRSDRVQNIRHECLQMIRHRRGRQPHLVTVTAEPLPTRLTAIARGTGEVDAVYHVAYAELARSVDANANAHQRAAWDEVTGQNRLLSYERLADTLASW